ncbi:hypothetical protein EGH21_21450 [Halomicroarcula sp. F13]|uniref:Signal transduction histidine kinase dimerisation/phosphoacceptor domain-containing protein n=1 Tax=Haloarcula rubra TaxID=2487747 RepID=A0AAW4PWQ4_9EURY|nr:histidine kinase dimerization/phospho-acceptor domain-containing protein [Halomicroarcula rubra]MBX0325592.1 hypothetical protein [Halomicroarcula rubra]
MISLLWHPFSHTLDRYSIGYLIVVLVLISGAGLGLLYGGYWHLHNPLPRDRYPRLLGWLLAGALLLMSIGVISLYLGSVQITQAELFAVLHLTSSLGIATGLLVGTVEATAIVQSRAAARTEAKARALERERDRIYRLTGLLRHHILNSLTVISGYVDYLSTDIPPEDEEKLDAIDERIKTITTLIENIRTLSTTLQDDSPQTQYDVEVLFKKVCEEVAPPQTVSITIPTDTPTLYTTVTFEQTLCLLFDALADVFDASDTFTVTACGSHEGVTISISTAEPKALTQESFSRAGPETDVKFALARELLTSSGTLQLDDSQDTTLACQFTVDTLASCNDNLTDNQ